jgi:single-strand DNA-binding protein
MRRPVNSLGKESNQMSGVNQITIVGHVGDTPSLQFSQEGTPYCRFSVAVNEEWKANGEKKSRVTWFPCVTFNAKSEICANFLDRGRLVGIQGRVQTREYEDRNGVRRQVMQVIADKVTFLGPSKRSDDSPRPTPGTPRASSSGAPGDEPPF